jgi:hypothetical protein
MSDVDIVKYTHTVPPPKSESKETK